MAQAFLASEGAKILADTLKTKSKDMAQMSQNMAQTQWSESTAAMGALKGLIDSLNVTAPAAADLKGKIASGTSEARAKLITQLVELVQSNTFQNGLEVFIQLLNLILSKMSDLTRLATIMAYWKMPDWWDEFIAFVNKGNWRI